MRSYGHFRAFSEQDLDDFLRNMERNAASNVQNEKDDYILSVGEDAYINHLVSANTIEPLNVLFEEITVETEEQMIPAEEFPSNYSVYPGKSYPKTVLTYRIPYTGGKALWRLRPSSYLMGGVPIILVETTNEGQDVVRFDSVVFNENEPAEQKQFVAKTIDHLKMYLESQKRDITLYNNRIADVFRTAFRAQKDKILKKRALVEAIGVPIKKRADESATFVIPPPEQRKKIVIKPPVSTAPFTPEPTLDEETYSAILKLIETTGINMERSPSLHYGKGEESIRDLFLLVLQSHFEGTAVGEAFNVSGKTDILFKHHAANIFVAECKIWRGDGQFLEAIDQLLGYLSYRDSKTALLVFVRNEDFQATVNKMTEAAKTHPQFLAEKGSIPSHGSYCRFKLPTDPSKEISIALIAFHLPDNEKKIKSKTKPKA